MIEITNNTAYKVYKKYEEERFRTPYDDGESHAELMINEIKCFLHDRFVLETPFDEAYADNIKHFTETQAHEIESIYEQL